MIKEIQACNRALLILLRIIDSPNYSKMYTIVSLRKWCQAVHTPSHPPPPSPRICCMLFKCPLEELISGKAKICDRLRVATSFLYELSLSRGLIRLLNIEALERLAARTFCNLFSEVHVIHLPCYKTFFGRDHMLKKNQSQRCVTRYSHRQLIFL